ncbi:hypothetical protein Leryth_024893 [Lithospermum erythrorhizon]|nr:hypothetical protein Leryth_024893 [Lithospermum erythrorhizon]
MSILLTTKMLMIITSGVEKKENCGTGSSQQVTSSYTAQLHPINSSDADPVECIQSSLTNKSTQYNEMTKLANLMVQENCVAGSSQQVTCINTAQLHPINSSDADPVECIQISLTNKSTRCDEAEKIANLMVQKNCGASSSHQGTSSNTAWVHPINSSDADPVDLVQSSLTNKSTQYNEATKFANLMVQANCTAGSSQQVASSNTAWRHPINRSDADLVKCVQSSLTKKSTQCNEATKSANLMLQENFGAGSSQQVTSSNTGWLHPINSSDADAVERVQISLTNKSTQYNLAGKSASSDMVPKDEGTEHTLPSNQQKNERNRVPFVISFSDDDDSEDSGRQNNAKLRELGVGRTTRLLGTSQQNPQKFQPRSLSKVGPRKVSFTRTFVPSDSRRKVVLSRNSGPSQYSRSFNTSNKVAAQDHGHNTKSIPYTSKLQDLRQLIDKKENEIKRKSSQQKKASILPQCKDNRFTGVGDGKARLSGTSSVDTIELEAKEPHKKRQKITKTRLSGLSAGKREEPQQSAIFASENVLLENSDKQKEDVRAEVVPPKKACALLASKKREGGHGTVNMKGGSDILEKTRRLSKLGGLVTIPKQHALTENDTCKNIHIKSNTIGLNLGAEQSTQQPSSAFQNNVDFENNVTENSGPRLIESNGEALEPTSHDRYHFHSHYASSGKPRTSDLSLDNPNFWDSIRMGRGDLGIQALLNLEASNDKELEEAQERRRQCEIEERKTLDFYRKAQRALTEANAKCSYLYRKREMFSAQLRSVMMENTNLFSTFGTNDQFELQLNHINFPDVNANLIPAASGNTQAKYDSSDQHIFYPTGVTPDDVNQSLQRQGVSGNDMVSIKSSEYDDSAKEPENGDDVYCPSEGSSMSEDGNGVTYQENVHVLEYERMEQTSGESEKEINMGSDGIEHLEGSQDSLLLEASLRSQLFERLRTNALTKKSFTGHVEPLDDGTGNDNGGKKGDLIPDNQLSSHEDEGKQSDLRGYQGSSFITFFYPLLRSAFHHLKISDPSSLVNLQSGLGSPEMQICDDNFRTQQSNYSWTSPQILKDLNVGNTGSYSCSVTIDPLQPLCMYDLRGKCNNDECAWQHVRKFACKDSLVSSAQKDEANVATRSYGSLDLIPPTYLIDLDVLHVNLCSYRSISTESFGQCWKKCFSSTLVLSSVLPVDLPLDEPFLHGNEPRVESEASGNRQLLYFDSKNASLKQSDCPIIDNDQALETALLNLQYEANKQKGRIEALKVLVRAVEADPTSAALWVVYLQIYYSNKKSIGKDDLFQYAVEYSKSSYELWLLYINSRTQFDDRLAAYSAALQALCCVHVSGPDVNAKQTSAYILDIFLQMMNSLCMSGNINRVLEIIYGLSPSSKRSDMVTFPDIIDFLSIYDKCVFWVSCVHLAIYRQVPDAIVQRFEFQKDLSAIEWPNTQLIGEEKQKAISLMESAVSSLEEEINSESLDNKDTLKAAHLFAVNHVKCVAVLEGLGCGRDLLEKYTILYPSCLELVLMLASTERDKFVGFEKAISNWLDDVPGIQCLWNQYVECALESQNFDFAKELITRWFNFASKMECAHNGTSGTIDADNVLQSVPASVPLGCCSFPDHNDVVFKLLNFSIYMALHGDETEALLALDRAIKASDTDNYFHCVREHSLFLCAGDLKHHKKSHFRTIMKLLNSYLVDPRASQKCAPLSRHYLQMIKKPRVQQLVYKLLNPLSNFSLLNSVLEVWYGPSLLPPKFENLSELVDFAEGVLGLLPSNYLLALSVCKLLIQSSGTAKLPANVSFWASSLLANALFLAVPVAPESVWIESAEILCHLTSMLYSESLYSLIGAPVLYKTMEIVLWFSK